MAESWIFQVCFFSNIEAGTSKRFEPGESKTVNLVDFAGSKIVYGGNGWLSGSLNQHHLIPEIIEKNLFRNIKQPPPMAQPPYQMNRLKYIQCYGPTVGDKVRLGDTELFLEIEKDFAVYGDEIVFGGGKVLRDGMGQMSNISEEKALDLVITNVIVVGKIAGLFLQ